MSDDGGVEKIDLEKVDWRGSREFFESLTDELRSLDDKDESYDFTWVGKRKSIIEAGTPINKTFRPDVKASKNWDTTENLFIEGDNLDALKLLQESYLGKVKMIYIDPPYNTGKDFVYHDNFRANVEQYDEDTEYRDEEGNIQFRKNEKTNGRYHSDWLSMMYPRLKLARNMLTEDGIILISIDDNEQANLKKLCDEVFGEDNFIANAIIVNNRGGRDYGGIARQHDYILIYTRNEGYQPNLINEKDKEFKLQDDQGGFNLMELRNRNIKFNLGNRPNLYYPFYLKPNREDSNGLLEISLEPEEGFIEVYPAKSSGIQTVWRWGKEEKARRNLNVEIFGKKNQNGGYMIVQKYRKTTKMQRSIWDDKEFVNERGTESVKELFDGVNYFDYPKSVFTIKRVVELGSKSDGIILDFFSGSATTAQAVMQLNAEDGGNRKWIMVQLPEETDEKSEAFKAGYKTIPEISRERIRRAGDKIASEHPSAKVDYGFRALRIDETNHKDVYRPAADYQQSMLDSLVDNVKEDRSDLDLLYGVLTATAWELNKPLEAVELSGMTVYKYDYFGEVSGLVACFADEISEDAIKQIAQLKPLTAVFKESSFPNSQAKVNLAEHFRIISPDTKVKVI